MLVKEKIKRQADQFFEVRLNEYEIDLLVRTLDDYATDPEISDFPYEDLRDMVDGQMLVNRMDAFSIVSVLENEDERGPVYRKFTSVLKDKVLPS